MAYRTPPKIDSFTRDVLRRFVYSQWQAGHVVTVAGLQAFLVRDCSIQASGETVRKAMHGAGFCFGVRISILF
jgi:hypothetical protein